MKAGLRNSDGIGFAGVPRLSQLFGFSTIPVRRVFVCDLVKMHPSAVDRATSVSRFVTLPRIFPIG